MTLTVGTRLGPYEIVAPLGSGGMGEVYRARDTKLDREVAIKVLPELFIADPERVARFQREAKTLAALNHPHIGGIYGLEDASGVHALVLELVEGPTLADRIAQGPIPIDEALPIARQIAEALEAAHEQGIIHRDLKPANIKLRPDGTVKVLDFGLAKALEPMSAATPNVTASPTITTPAMMTGIGMILGTAAYMSPEQAKGRPADKRSDVWAFGCVLYEMLTGKRAFEGDDVSDTLAFVLTKEPEWATLARTTPVPIQRLLRRSLQKDRRRRLADFTDVRIEIDDGLAADTEALVPVATEAAKTVRRRSAAIAAGALILGGVLGAGAVWSRSSTPTVRVTRFAVPIPADQPLIEFGHQLLAVSRDSASIAYVANRRIYLRSMGDVEARPLTGTEMPVGQIGAPAFSPDGQSIAFLAASTLVHRNIKVVPTSGGAAVTVCDGCNAVGSLSWDERGILFVESNPNQSTSRIMRASPAGGPPTPLATVNDGAVWDAQLLPDGDHVLFTFATTAPGPQGMPIRSWDRAKVVTQSLKSGERQTVIDGGAAARFVSSGHIVFARSGVLFAAPFDVRRLATTGPPLAVVQGVKRQDTREGGFVSGSVYFAISNSGALVYVSGPAAFSSESDIALLDQQSGIVPLKLSPRAYRFPRVSPDGKWVAVGVDDGTSANVLIYELSGVTSLRQLTTRGKNRFPIWSPDSAMVTFQSDRDGDLGIFRQPANGSRDVERLTTADPSVTHVPDAWSPDGKTLLFEEARGSFNTLKALSMTDKKATAVGDIGETYPIDATFSPNGRFIAYRTPGQRSIVAVQPFPPTGPKIPVTEGVYPVWSSNGKSLMFRRLTTGEFFITDVTTSTEFTFTTPRQLTRSFSERMSNAGRRNYDILPDGRILGVVTIADAQSKPATPEIQVVLNWIEELKQRVPLKQP